VLPAVIAEFRRKFPKVTMHLVTGNTKSVVEYLNSGGIDIALVEGDVKKQKLVVEKLIPDEMVLIMSPLHPWAKRSNISVFDIAKENFIFREDGSGTRQMIEKFFTKHGISPQGFKIAFIMGSTEAIKAAVEEGLGVSIVSRWAVKKENRYGTLKTSTFKEDRFLRDFCLVHRKAKDSSFTLDKFIGFLKKYSFEKLLNA
jgi:DNA-binding transcriptional LysR family regulator